MVRLCDKPIGGIIKIKENDTAMNYIIVHKGKPSSMYDDSCDGVWVLREQGYPKIRWDPSGTDYENSEIKAWLNGTFLNTIDSKIRAAIKTVKIPFKKGAASDSTPVQSGSNGLLCKVFLLSNRELGLAGYTNFPDDGAKLSYFLDGADTNASAKRTCKNDSGTNDHWWTRSVYADKSYANTYYYVVGILSGGSPHGSGGNTLSHMARPAFILPSSILVDDEGNVYKNTPPTITSNKTGDLGKLMNGFTCNYSVDDVDDFSDVRVTLSMDSKTIKTFKATKKKQETYSLTGDNWLKTPNGSYVFMIEASDGFETMTSTATFTRNCNRLTVTLSAPLEADDKIVACSLKVAGSIPSDAMCLYEVTNNANDPEPVWEDCTIKAKDGLPYVFINKTVKNNPAFNFRVTIERGLSNVGGYITKISGGFE